jgi:hypothetical protein
MAVHPSQQQLRIHWKCLAGTNKVIGDDGTGQGFYLSDRMITLGFASIALLPLVILLFAQRLPDLSKSINGQTADRSFRLKMARSFALLCRMMPFVNFLLAPILGQKSNNLALYLNLYLPIIGFLFRIGGLALFMSRADPWEKLLGPLAIIMALGMQAFLLLAGVAMA